LQTEADRAAQYCIEKSLQQKFGNKLKIIGEEEVTSSVPIIELGFSLEVLNADKKCQADLREIKEEDLVIWVDPLDGTSEFVEFEKSDSKLLHQVTVLIGIVYKGRPIAGVVHQPFFNNQGRGRTIWGINGVGTFGHNSTTLDGSERLIVTSKSHFTPALQNALDILSNKNLSTRIDRVGGAGFKVLQCLEGAAAYIAASGCKKWDTAAPEAILTAAGGKLTDITGQEIYYGPDAEYRNSNGVLATSPLVDHQEYVDAIPSDVKRLLSG